MNNQGWKVKTCLVISLCTQHTIPPRIGLSSWKRRENSDYTLWQKLWYPWIAILNWVLLLQRCFDCSVTIKFVNNKNQETINQRMTINEGSWHWNGPSWQCWQSRLVLAGDPHLLRISLLWISLMRIFKTFQIFS